MPPSRKNTLIQYAKPVSKTRASLLPVTSFFLNVRTLFPLRRQGISMRREFRVCDEGDKLHVREDVCKGGDTMSHTEARVDKKYPTTTTTTNPPVATVAAKKPNEGDGVVAQEGEAEPTAAKKADAAEEVENAPVSM